MRCKWLCLVCTSRSKNCVAQGQSNPECVVVALCRISAPGRRRAVARGQCAGTSLDGVWVQSEDLCVSCHATVELLSAASWVCHIGSGGRLPVDSHAGRYGPAHVAHGGTPSK